MCKIYQTMPFVKGQVWLVDEPREVTEARLHAGTHCQVKTRPWMIYISNSDAQLPFNVVQGFPITTTEPMVDDRKKSFYDFDFRFYNARNEVNRLVTGQLTTLDIRYFRKYLFTMPDELLEELDRLMIKRFGLDGELNNMKRRIEELERELKYVKSAPPQFIVQAAPAQVPTPAPVKKPEPVQRQEPEPVKVPINNPQPTLEQIECSPSTPVTPNETEIPTKGNSEEPPMKKEAKVVKLPSSLSHTKSGRIRWTEDAMREFLHDCNTLENAEISERWGLGATQILARKIYCKDKLAGKKVSGPSGNAKRDNV